MQTNTLKALIQETEFLQECITNIKQKMSSTKELLDSVAMRTSSLSPLKHDTLVRTSSIAHINIEYTRRLLSKVKEFDARYNRLKKEIKESTESPSTLSLLSVYKELKELVGLRNTTPEITERINILEKHFDIFILTLIDTLPELVKKEGPVAYLKIVRISTNESSPTEKKNNSLKINCNLDRSRIFEVFLESIDRRFNENLPSDNKLIKSDSLSFVLEDLSSLQATERFIVCSKYKIFPFASIQYHRLLCEYLDKKTDHFDPNESIGILLWSKKYYLEMEKMGRVKSSLGPVLFSGKEGELTNKYAAAAENKLSEWIGNLAHMESKRFKERKKAPDLDNDNKFISIGFMDLLHIIRQQLEPIYSHPEIFKRVSAHILNCVKEFKNTLMEAVLEELDLVLKDKAHNGFEEYCIALSNSGLKFMDCLQSLSFYTDPNIQSISEVFYECMADSNDALVRNILAVVSPATDNMFTREWSTEPVIQTVISTYNDYLADYKESMIDYAFTFFVSHLLEKTIDLYFDRSAKKRSVFLKEHLPLISNDRKRYREFFSNYISKSSVKDLLKPLDYFISITSSDNISICTSEIILYLKEFPKTPKDKIIKILKRMPGGGKEFSKEISNRIS